MVDYSYRSDSDFNGEGIGLETETNLGDRSRHSVVDVCNERLVIFQSRYNAGSLSICSKVRKAQETFSEQCSDFDSVTKFLNDDDPNVGNDAATMLLEI